MKCGETDSLKITHTMESRFTRLCLFCGSSEGKEPIYMQVGQAQSQHSRLTLVFRWRRSWAARWRRGTSVWSTEAVCRTRAQELRDANYMTVASQATSASWAPLRARLRPVAHPSLGSFQLRWPRRSSVAPPWVNRRSCRVSEGWESGKHAFDCLAPPHLRHAHPQGAHVRSTAPCPPWPCKPFILAHSGPSSATATSPFLEALARWTSSLKSFAGCG
jgi:hypothetical protein